MGVRVVVAENEPIRLALRRLKKHADCNGVPWEMRRRNHFVKATAERRAEEFHRRFKARKAILVAKLAGRQATTAPPDELLEEFWRRTGKK
jgi:ribosomal protein S21